MKRIKKTKKNNKPSQVDIQQSFQNKIRQKISRENNIKFQTLIMRENEKKQDFIQKQLQENTLKYLAKTVGKKIPLAGLAISAEDVAERVNKGDYKGATLTAVSGAVASFPVVGTGASIAIDMYIKSGDEEKKILKTQEIMDLKQKEIEVERLGFLKILDEQKLQELDQIVRAQAAEALEEKKRQDQQRELDQQKQNVLGRNNKTINHNYDHLQVATEKARKVDSSSLKKEVQNEIKAESPLSINTSKEVKEKMSKMRGKEDFSEERPKGHPDLVKENKAMGNRSSKTLTMEEVSEIKMQGN